MLHEIWCECGVNMVRVGKAVVRAQSNAVLPGGGCYAGKAGAVRAGNKERERGRRAATGSERENRDEAREQGQGARMGTWFQIAGVVQQAHGDAHCSMKPLIAACVTSRARCMGELLAASFPASSRLVRLFKPN